MMIMGTLLGQRNRIFTSDGVYKQNHILGEQIEGMLTLGGICEVQI